MPRPDSNPPSRKKTTSRDAQRRKDNASSGRTQDRQTRQTDTGHEIRNNQAQERRRSEQHRSDSARSGRTQDRNMRQTDTGNVIRNRQAKEQRISEQHRYDSTKSGKTQDRQMRQTDTGTRSKNERIKEQRRKQWSANYDINKNAQKIERYTDNNTRGSRGNVFSNSEVNKAYMKKKYGDRNDNRLTTYDRANYKGQEIERKVKQRWKPSDVSSQRPGESGREWDKHKYIDKVRTKSGKIRYIYNVEGGGSSHEDAGKTMRKNQNSKASSQINYNRAQARKAARSAGNKVKSFFSKLFG